MTQTIESSVVESTCGHAFENNECSLLCDDFVTNTDGYCYLAAFELEGRQKALRDLRKSPIANEFNYYYNCSEHAITCHVIPPIELGGKIHMQPDSIAGQDFTVMTIGECKHCKKVTQSYSNTIKPKHRKFCADNCFEDEGAFLCVSLIRFSLFANKIGSKVSIKNLIRNESAALTYELRDPSMYISDIDIPECEYDVTYEDDVVTLKINDCTISYNRYDQKLKGFTHDFVSSCWQDHTDTKLEVLGAEGPIARLTPDYIIEGTRCVLEVTTCATDNEKAIKNAYADKVVHYHGDLERLKAKFFIAVVSPQKVFTNALINQQMVDLLTQRMRMVMPLKQRVIEVLGEDITDNEFNETERLAKSMFSEKYDFGTLEDKYKYVKSEIEECSQDLTNQEAISAARILLSRYETTKNVHSASKKDLDEYLTKFTAENTRSDMKRISNVPFILPGIDQGYLDTSFEGASSLRSIWAEVTQKKVTEAPTVSLNMVINDEELDKKHMTKRSMLAKANLTNEEKIEAAMSGVGGKAYKDEEPITQHREVSKLSFHPLVDTSDIEEFSRCNLLHIDGEPNLYLGHLLKTAVLESKYMSTGDSECKSADLWNRIMLTDIMKYSMMMSHVFMELAYTYKHWTHHYEFLHKDLGNGVHAIIYNPKSTLFVTFAFPKVGCKQWDLGRLGPKMFESSTHYFTDWSSFDNSQLEHFMKFGPYVGSCIVELMNCSESDSNDFSKYTKECIPHILMLYCNNKTDVEELVTSQRYLFMKLLEDVGKSPYIFVERFPKVLRSRLTAYYLKKTMTLLDYYDQNSITKVPKQGEDMILYDYMNIKSLFSNTFVSLSCKINEFYFGYVVSKERNTGKDKTFKVLTKLIKQEQKFRKNVKGSIFTRNEDYQEFKVNMPLLKFFSSAFSDLLVAKFGPDYKTKIMNDFIHSVSRTNFSDLATLKVSARDHSKEVEVPLGSESTEQIYNKLKDQFPEEIIKRPFCMESMTLIIERYQNDTNKSITHISQLAPWCLKKLLEKGYFDSDQFDKSQHGGEREIHVLEFMARIVQFFIELISRTVCSYFPSETTVNPDTKDRFVRDHYSKSKEMFGSNFVTISKSADATTWCQFHHSSHFAAMFQAILPDELKEFTLSALSLWPRKRLSFPLKQASSLSANIKLKTDNDTYMGFKKDFEEGNGMFVKARSNVIEVISGMFQGILHTTSSLYHTMIQEVMRQVIINTCKNRLMMDKVLVTVCQGSDDSGCMISVPGKPNLKTMSLLKRLLLWKERVSPYLSVFCNEAKSSIGTHDLIEYNSEWHIRHMIIKPTFRWVSASQELSVTERFIDRFRMYNNMITECLSGGASSLECSVIQMFQATMHYILMGLHNKKSEDVKTRYLELLLENPEPLFGFFPMDDDVSCGVTGVEFLLYKLYKNTSFGSNLRVLGDSELAMDYSPEDLPDWMKTKDLSSIRLKFSNMKVFYRVLERMNLEPLEMAISAVEEDPTILFSRSNSWTDEQHNLVLKVFSKGVKESISNKSSMLRMAASSAYILTNKCFTDNNSKIVKTETYIDNKGNKQSHKVIEKHTLLSLMIKHKESVRYAHKTENTMKTLFPYHEEYKRIQSDLDNLKKNGLLISQYTKRTSKVKITVIPKPVGEVDVIDMCKRRWFDKGVHSLSQGQFKRKWAELIEKFSFISDERGILGLQETSKNLNLSVIQTKMFLESMTARSRSVVLYDSSSKSGNLSYSLSRIYWPGSKIVLPSSSLEDKVSELRCKLFSVLTFWFTDQFKIDSCKELIKNDYSLNRSYQLIPSYGLKLKIISEVLRGTDNHNLIHRIESSKKGLLGSFVQVQKGRGSSRKGRGIWQGSICGIGTRIVMEGNVCTQIVVNTLYDTLTLGWHLNQFMNDASLKMPEQSSIKKETNCWLTNEGRIVVSREQRGVPIYQDASMRVVGTEQTANMSWHVDIKDNNIRVRARDPVTTSMFTILSDTITNRDWISGVSLDIDDPIFNKWARGEAIHLPSLEQVLTTSFPNTRYEFMKEKSRFNEGKLYNNFNWDYKRMQRVLRDAIINRGYVSDSEKRLEKSDIEVMNNDVMMRFTNMMEKAFVDFDNLELDAEIEDWAAEVEMEEELEQDFWGLEITPEEEEELRGNMNLFKDSSSEEYFELIDRNDLTKNFSMPSTVRFLSPLEHLNIVMNKESMRQSIIKERSSPSILGIIYTIVTGKFLIGKDDGLASEVIEVEDDISNISSSVSRPGALMTLTLDEVRINIANLQNQIEVSPKLVSRRLERLLAVYKDREEEIMNRIDPGTHDLIMLNSDLIIEQLIENFSSKHLLQIDLSGLDDELKMNLFTTMVKTEVSRCSILSQSEKDEVSLHISMRSISRSSLQSIALAYNISVMLNKELIFSTDESRPNILLQM